MPCWLDSFCTNEDWNRYRFVWTPQFRFLTFLGNEILPYETDVGHPRLADRGCEKWMSEILRRCMIRLDSAFSGRKKGSKLSFQERPVYLVGGSRVGSGGVEFPVRQRARVWSVVCLNSGWARCAGNVCRRPRPREDCLAPLSQFPRLPVSLFGKNPNWII